MLCTHVRLMINLIITVICFPGWVRWLDLPDEVKVRSKGHRLSILTVCDYCTDVFLYLQHVKTVVMFQKDNFRSSVDLIALKRSKGCRVIKHILHNLCLYILIYVYIVIFLM